MIMPKIYMIDIKSSMTKELEKSFEGTDVVIQTIDFESFMKANTDVEGIVSPANSFGLMDGGYDLAITNYFGESLYPAVQERLYEEYLGEQPVGTCLLVDIPNTTKKLLHTPSMRTPEVILDPRVIYACMRNTLITAMKNNVKSLVIPAFGGRTGMVPGKIIAEMMRLAYDSIEEKRMTIQYNTWGNINFVPSPM